MHVCILLSVVGMGRFADEQAIRHPLPLRTHIPPPPLGLKCQSPPVAWSLPRAKAAPVWSPVLPQVPHVPQVPQVAEVLQMLQVLWVLRLRWRGRHGTPQSAGPVVLLDTPAVHTRALPDAHCRGRCHPSSSLGPRASTATGSCPGSGQTTSPGRGSASTARRTASPLGSKLQSSRAHK